MLLILLSLACVHHAVPAATGAAPIASEAQVEPLAPRPFGAAALAAGIPNGTVIRLRIESAGDPTVEQRWEFSDGTADSVVIDSRVYDDKGVLLKDEGTSKNLWADLEKHASFPAAATSRTDEVYDGPLGHLAVWLYTVTVAGDDGIMLVKRYQFAKTIPGPPVLFTIERQGEEIFRMTMLERSPR